MTGSAAPYVGRFLRFMNRKNRLVDEGAGARPAPVMRYDMELKA